MMAMTHPAPTVRVCHVGTVIVLVLLDRGDDGRWGEMGGGETWTA